jgi:hypothetical protein
MKFRPVLLFWGAVLIAAVPVWTDGIPHSTIVADSGQPARGGNNLGARTFSLDEFGSCSTT